MKCFIKPFGSRKGGRTLPFWGILLSLASCDWINPAEPIPAYIRVEPFELTADPRTQGSASHNITEVWMKANGDFLGVYRLPAEIPVLKTGPAEISLEAGIKENGIGITPDIYPFYQPFTAQAALSPDQDLTLRPSIRYRPETRFSLIEGFENSGHLFQLLISGKEANRIQIIRENAFEGTASGQIALDATGPEVELATSARFSGLLDRGNALFLELNYQSEVPVSFGLIASPRGGGSSRIQYVAGFNPSNTWKKIYFNLSPAVSGSKTEDYQVILRAAIPLNTDGTLSRTNARIHLDNIKLVHF